MFNQDFELDESLNRAFKLAYFILGDRPAAVYVAMAAMDKLKTAISNQTRRRRYTPIGRLQYPAARTKVNLSELHLLQRLVYVESELFERLIEGQRKYIHREDLIIRYVKHLIRVTTKHNSFYVTLGLCRLLYNYSTGNTSDIYNLVLQDPERIRDDYYYRSRKQRMMEEIRQRFGSLIKTRRGFRREERFQSDEDSRKFTMLVRQCLIRFTPWNSTCVLPKDIDLKQNVISQLLFAGDDPDEEHQVELNRMHSLIHPDCLKRLTAALILEAPEKRLELPTFFVTNEGSWSSEDRFNPQELTEDELDAMRRYLQKNCAQRKQFSGAPLRLLIDGRAQADFELEPLRAAKFHVADGSDFIEIRSLGSLGNDSETTLAVSVLGYDQSGILPSDLAVPFSNGQQLALALSPFLDVSGEANGATLSVRCEPTTVRPSFEVPRQIAESGLLFFRGLIGLWALKPALAVLLISFTTVGLWVYLHPRRSLTDQSQVAKLQENHGQEIERTSGSSVPQPRDDTATPSPEIRQPKNGLGSNQAAPPGAAEQSQKTERLRGTRRRPSSISLTAVKRVYVDPLGVDSFALELRETLIRALRAGQHFEVVSNRDAADAVFRGSARQPITRDSPPSVVLELVNAGGQVIWSLSSHQNENLSSDPEVAAADILKLLSGDLETLPRN